MLNFIIFLNIYIYKVNNSVSRNWIKWRKLRWYEFMDKMYLKLALRACIDGTALVLQLQFAVKAADGSTLRKRTARRFRPNNLRKFHIPHSVIHFVLLLMHLISLEFPHIKKFYYCHACCLNSRSDWGWRLDLVLLKLRYSFKDSPRIRQSECLKLRAGKGALPNNFRIFYCFEWTVYAL